MVGWRWFRLILAGGDKMMDGARGINSLYKKLFIAFSRFCFALASFLFRYVAPRAELQLLQLATYPSSIVPPLSDSTRWSSSVAVFFLHQWQMGESRSSSARACL